MLIYNKKNFIGFVKTTQAYLGPKGIRLKTGSGFDFGISVHIKSLYCHLLPLNGLHLVEDPGVFGRSYKTKKPFVSQSTSVAKANLILVA